MRLAVLAVAAVLAGSFATDGAAQSIDTKKPARTTVPNPDPLPKNYRAHIVEYAKTHYVDPPSIREAAIAAPFYGSPRLNFYGGPLAYVCVRANAQNKSGIYSGLKTTAYLFHGGKVVGTHTDKMGLITCRAPAPYSPFPELERIPKLRQS